MSEKPKLRLLAKDELQKLRSFYKSVGSTIDPRQQLLTAAVAQLPDETIVGFCGFELIPHVGPVQIIEPFRGQGLAVQLYELIEAQLDKKPHTGYYTFPSNDASKRVASKLGLTKLDWEIWKREY